MSHITWKWASGGAAAGTVPLLNVLKGEQAFIVEELWIMSTANLTLRVKPNAEITLGGNLQSDAGELWTGDHEFIVLANTPLPLPFKGTLISNCQVYASASATIILKFQGKYRKLTESEFASLAAREISTLVSDFSNMTKTLLEWEGDETP